MAKDDKPAPEAYGRAREMTQKALDAFVAGDDKTGETLVAQANDVNKDAVREVHAELEEDAVSEHDPKKLNQR
jgi:hypothetical protein